MICKEYIRKHLRKCNIVYSVHKHKQVRTVLDTTEKSFEESYIPVRQLSIDEGMMKFT